MTRRGSAAMLVATVVTTVMAFAAGCGGSSDCTGDEEFRVRSEGSCSPEPRSFVLGRFGCFVRTSEASGPTGLPAIGALGQGQLPLREGGFVLWGAACDGPSSQCPADASASASASASFRLCRAERVSHYLHLECLDSTGAPVCTTRLTESRPGAP